MRLLDFSDPDFVQQSEGYWFLGIILAGVDYGINITLLVICANFLRRRILEHRRDRLDPGQYRWDVISLCYVLVMFGFATSSMVLEIRVTEDAFVELRDLPGGPSFYLCKRVFGRITTLRAGYVTLVLCHCCAEGLLVSRRV